MSPDDIGPFLERWPFNEGGNVRKILGLDGTEKIQIRVLSDGMHGILQFNADGRPDGKRPHEREFALDYFEEFLKQQGGGPGRFKLTHEQAEELFEESSVIYQRYVILLQMSDYARVLRDTERNMRVFAFVHRYASDEDKNQLEKWWPYIIRIHHTAQAMLCLDQKDFAGADAAVARARRELEELTPQDDDVFREEMKRSEKALEDVVKLIEERRPVSEAERLEREKNDAIRREDYETAARLRDRIRDLKKDVEPPK